MDSHPQAIQRCIEPSCGASFALDERRYTCMRCGGLLDIESEPTAAATTLKRVWRERMTSFDVRDRSGVWRYRELLPFADDISIVSLAEGNTALRSTQGRSLLWSQFPETQTPGR